MGEAKRRSSAPKADRPDLESGFDQQERALLANVRRGAYRHATLHLARARASRDAAAQGEAIAAIHAEAARVLDDATVQFFRTTREGPAIEARIACRKGCNFCCYVNVEVTIVEAIGVAAAAAKGAGLRDAVLGTAPRLAGLDALGRIQARVACALLRDGGCSVYADRPRGCRAFTSYDAKRCEDELNHPEAPREKTRTFTWPRFLASAASDGIQMACRDLRLQDATVELTQGVAAVLRDPAIVSRWLAGEAAFPAYAKDSA
jgi:Fe-S-cluster containining protein